MKKKLSRRGLLAGLGAAAGAMALPSLVGNKRAHSAGEDDTEARFLIVLGMFGGASIIDSFLPFTHNESPNPESVNCFPVGNVVQPNGSNIRGVEWDGNVFGSFESFVPDFLTAHHQDMLVATYTGTSVNHTVAQKRAITGNGAWSGRTLQEAVANQFGANCPLPNVNMGSLGYAAHGDDNALPSYAYMEPVSVPQLWPLALHGSRGVKIDDSGILDAPDPELIKMARDMRNDLLDPQSGFYTTFQLSDKLQRWKHQRNVLQPKLEEADLITKLNMLNESAEYPFSSYGLATSADAAAVQAQFPKLERDPLEAQAALAYLLIKNRISSSVTVGPNFNLVLGDQDLGDSLLLNPPLSFDNSHTDHRDTQAFMWSRMLKIADGLISLLKNVEVEPGVSFWERTMIYCATDFGRSKGRNAIDDDAFGSGHDLNNGMLAISPMLAGNKVLGGVNTQSGETYGFNPDNGNPDQGRQMTEKEIYAGLAQAIGLDTSGSSLPNMPAFTS